MFPVASSPKFRFLQSNAWFPALTADQQSAIDAQVVTLTAERGTVVLPANEQTQGWYGVLHGLVRISAAAATGRRSDFLGVAGGEWFGEGVAFHQLCATSLADMSRQTANRVLNALQEQRVIRLSMNRIRVLDDTALTRLLDS